jgi:hypothetical protein
MNGTKKETTHQAQISENDTKSLSVTELSSQSSGTIINIFIPEGVVVSLLNAIEITLPSSVRLMIKFPFLQDNATLQTLINSIKQTGGSIEITNE